VPQADMCVAMASITHGCGLLHLWLSSSMVQSDVRSGGVASWQLPHGGSLGSSGATIHDEEEMAVQLVKPVRMPPSIEVPVGVIFLVGGDGGASPDPLFQGETSDPREATIDGGAHGCRRPCWRRYGGSQIR
jgi:hypothetical protein